jgi:hypothetical protein
MVAFKMGRRQAGPSRTGTKGSYLIDTYPVSIINTRDQCRECSEFQPCVFKIAANRAAPVREAVISVPSRSRSRTR